MRKHTQSTQESLKEATMRPQIGPTDGQVQRLRDLGYEPKNFIDTPTNEIFKIIGRGLKRDPTVVREREAMVQYWEQERKRAIAGEGLAPGMQVLRRSHRRTGDAAWIPDVIKSITKDGRICFEGITKPVNPSQIRPMP